MISLRRSAQRGHANHGWLDTWHTFSFGDYHDPTQMGFRSLRVINEDFIAPGQGFGMHGHRDMEIITYVLEGELAHRDSLESQAVLKAGEFQRMTAGRGIRHSEFNPSATETVHLYQIWIRPQQAGLEPSYEDRRFPREGMHQKLQLIASHDGRDGSLPIQQDASLFRGELSDGTELRHPLGSGRHAWLQVVRGEVDLAGQVLSAGDGAAISEEPQVVLRGNGPGEVLLFDLD